MRVGDSIRGSIYNRGKDLFTFFVYLPSGHPVHPCGGCYNRNEPNILQSSDFRYYDGNYDTRHDFKHMKVMLIIGNCGDYPG